MNNQEDLNFAAQPKVVQPKSKYRDQEEDYGKIQYSNMMFDRHIVRGNTYAPIINQKQEEQQTTVSKNQYRSKKVNQLAQNQDVLMSQQQQLQQQGIDDHPAVPGRINTTVQTDEFVESQTDKPPEYQKECQTDFDMTEQIKRLYIQEPTGINVEVQIWDGDLFNFDYESEPMLQVLVSKTLQDSRLEVLQEEELKALNEEQQHYHDLESQEQQHFKEFEAREIQKIQDKEEKVKQFTQKHNQNLQSHKLLVSRVTAKQFCKFLQPKFLDELENQGLFRPSFQNYLYEDFMPEIYNGIENQLNKKQKIRSFLDQFIIDVNQQNIEQHKSKLQIQQDEFKRKREEKQQKEEQDEKEKQEKQRLRAEKKELKRRDELVQQILTNMIKDEEKPNILAGNCSDINGYNQEQAFVGFFGGLIGEISIFLQVLDQLKNYDNPQFEYMKKLEIDEEQITQSFTEVINYIVQMEGSIDISVSKKIADTLQKTFEEEVTLDNLKEQLNNADKQGKIFEILQNQFLQNPPFILKLIIDHNNVLKQQIESFVKILFELMKDEAVLPKINLIQWSGDYPKEIKQVCLAKMNPDIQQLPLKPQSDKYELQQQLQQEAEQEVEDTQEQPAEKQQIIVKNLAECEIENKYKPFSPVGDFKVFILHPVAEYFVRQQVLAELGKVNQFLIDKEFNILLEATDIISDLQQEILDSHTKNFPILNMKSY